MNHAGTANEHYSLLTDNEHSLNAQFVQRGQRMIEETHTWLDLPTLGDRATVVGAVGLNFKSDTVKVERKPTGEPIGEGHDTQLLSNVCWIMRVSERNPLEMQVSWGTWCVNCVNFRVDGKPNLTYATIA